MSDSILDMVLGGTKVVPLRTPYDSREDATAAALGLYAAEDVIVQHLGESWFWRLRGEPVLTAESVAEMGEVGGELGVEDDGEPEGVDDSGFGPGEAPMGDVPDGWQQIEAPDGGVDGDVVTGHVAAEPGRMVMVCLAVRIEEGLAAGFATQISKKLGYPVEQRDARTFEVLGTVNPFDRPARAGRGKVAAVAGGDRAPDPIEAGVWDIDAIPGESNRKYAAKFRDAIVALEAKLDLAALEVFDVPGFHADDARKGNTYSKMACRFLRGALTRVRPQVEAREAALDAEFGPAHC